MRVALLCLASFFSIFPRAGFPVARAEAKQLVGASPASGPPAVTPSAARPVPFWILSSDAVAREYAKADGAIFPERAAAVGLHEFDGKGIHMERDANARELAFLGQWRARADRERAASSDPSFRLDMTILRDHLQRRIEEIRLEERLGVVFFLPGTRFVLESLLALVSDQAPPDRKAAAVGRFRSYVRGDLAHPPLLTAFRNRILADELRFRKKRLMPLHAQVEQYLAESPTYLQGVREALVRSGREGWEADFAEFSEQSRDFDEFLRSHLLPLTRREFRLPKELYAHALRMRGVESSPRQLIQSARAAYKSLYRDFRAVAREAAVAAGSERVDPVSVIRRLKDKQVTEPAAVKALFEAADRQLAGIVEREQLVTLPKEPLRIRVAGQAESMAHPVPHLSAVPRLEGAPGERPELVVPAVGQGKAALDDFSYEAAALVLAAHEGRPGHELQFSAMLDQGTSLIRARYAFNSASAEGWALYAEEMVYPFLPASARLVALQSRLLRVARAFLDPEVQLGLMRPEDVPGFLVRELGISKRLAALELRRFQYDDPGQAPSYFYGLTRMEGARRRVSSALGRRFTERCFHDGVLGLGMLPLGALGGELERVLRCGKGQARLGR